MIGVIADIAEHEAVREFFEAFKTPWEFYGEGTRYDVVLCSGDFQFDSTAGLIVLYASGRTGFDDRQGIPTGQQRSQGCMLSYRGSCIPIYAEAITFTNNDDLLVDEHSHESVVHLDRSGRATFCRIGYNLFAELRTLLCVGQPIVNAAIPTLELHIAVLRELISGCGISLVEIPPVPDGYEFIVCLTHDVDHPSICPHKWDHTAIGFLYRAVFGSLRNFIGGRISARDLLTNWEAALKLPFVYLGLADDFWRHFAERYLAIEEGVPSTFFVIPFQGRPGKSGNHGVAKLRSAKYGAEDVADSIRKLRAAGCEVALHGIDAWVDGAAAEEELAEIRRLTGASDIGVRMHWLFYGEQSPLILEQARAAYDSTVGYNETVGYRAGTTQAYKPFGTKHLLELPLHIMDTALFYPAHLGLTPQQAEPYLQRMTEDVVRFGGCLTINWHDRSVAPERLWGATYRHLLQDLKRRGAWFATAGQAASWFRKRRAATFEADCERPGKVGVNVKGSHRESLPGLRLRIHQHKSWDVSCNLSGELVGTALDDSSVDAYVSGTVH